jgi:hypothetical protein
MKLIWDDIKDLINKIDDIDTEKRNKKLLLNNWNNSFKIKQEIEELENNIKSLFDKIIELWKQ